MRRIRVNTDLRMAVGTVTFTTKRIFRSNSWQNVFATSHQNIVHSPINKFLTVTTPPKVTRHIAYHQ
jgi:hypothetical protein